MASRSQSRMGHAFRAGSRWNDGHEKLRLQPTAEYRATGSSTQISRRWEQILWYRPPHRRSCRRRVWWYPSARKPKTVSEERHMNAKVAFPRAYPDGLHKLDPKTRHKSAEVLGRRLSGSLRSFPIGNRYGRNAPRAVGRRANGDRLNWADSGRPPEDQRRPLCARSSHPLAASRTGNFDP